MAGNRLKPCIWNETHDVVQHLWSQPLVRGSRSLRNFGGPREQNVMFNLSKGGRDLFLHRGPVVMKEKCCSVIDGIELVVPHKQVRIARGAVNVVCKCVEPHQ